jgi:hypothetical protein
MHAERKITIHYHKHSFTPYFSLSPYSQMDGMTDGETNTLAARGLEELLFAVLERFLQPIHVLRVLCKN